MNLNDFLADSPPRFRPPKAASPPKMEAALRELEVTLSKVSEQPPPEGAATFLMRLRTVAASGEWASLGNRDWRYGVQLLWDPADPVGEDSTIVERILGWVKERSSRSSYRLLISAYLQGFKSDRAGIRKAAQVLRSGLEKLPVPWGDRHKQFRLFEPDEAPKFIAAAVLSRTGSVRASLADMGLSGVRIFGLPAESYLVALQLLKAGCVETHPNLKHLDSILDWSEENGQLTYPSAKNALLEVILSIWLDRPPPPAQYKEIISAFVLRVFKDPRIEKRHWNGTPDSAQKVMKRWLTQVALEQFIKILDETAVEKQWQYRSAFWMSYFNQGYIQEAWVLFGPQALGLARSAFGKDVSYGILRGGLGVQPDHSVLLLRIQNLIIADWSHNGTCRVWIDGNEKVPNFYLHAMTRPQLVDGADFSQPHHYSVGGTWQRGVESFIRKKTGIRIGSGEYMP